MDRGAWQAIVHRVAKSQTWLKQLSTHAHLHSYSYQKTKTNETPSYSLYLLSRCSPPLTHYSSHPVNLPFCLQHVWWTVNSTSSQLITWLTPSPSLMPSLVWSMETALNWSLPYILSLTLSLTKSPLQDMKLIMLLTWLRSFCRSHCPKDRDTLLAENSQSGPNLSCLLSQKHLQNSGLTPMSALSLILTSHCFLFWLETLSPFIPQTVPFLSFTDHPSRSSCSLVCVHPSVMFMSWKKSLPNLDNKYFSSLFPSRNFIFLVSTLIKYLIIGKQCELWIEALYFFSSLSSSLSSSYRNIFVASLF